MISIALCREYSKDRFKNIRSPLQFGAKFQREVLVNEICADCLRNAFLKSKEKVEEIMTKITAVTKDDGHAGTSMKRPCSSSSSSPAVKRRRKKLEWAAKLAVMRRAASKKKPRRKVVISKPKGVTPVKVDPAKTKGRGKVAKTKGGRKAAKTKGPKP